MRRLVTWIQGIAFGLGGFGLFLVAFADSSFLSLPEIADILVVVMVARDKTRMPIYVLAALAGSLAGCLIIYYIGRKGGEALVRRRFGGTSVDRALGALRRYGTMAVLIPSVLPPPMPFKIFVFLAGVAEISAVRFTLAVLLGRGGRYLVLGILAVRYGDRAMDTFREHGVGVSLAIVGVLLAGLLAYLLWRKSHKVVR
jgi:membrane protein YqaA with SNARE-associated domain